MWRSFPPLALLLILTACTDPTTSAPDGGPAAEVDAARESDAASTGLRIVTANLRCLVEDWDQRLPLIVAEVAELNPDIIALQEVCRQEGGGDSLSEFVAALELATGSDYSFSRAETHLAWDLYHEGIALLTRHGFESVETIELPSGIFPRKAIVATLTAAGKPLVFAVTHLSFGDQESVRVNQLGALRDHLETLRSPGTSSLIAGDLNEGPGGGAVSAATAAGYQDAWDTLHPGEMGPTYPASAPQARIDYVLMSPGDTSLHFSAVQRFLDEATEGRYPSDHFALSVVLD